MLNLNNPTQGTQCGAKDIPTTQRLGETRHGESFISTSLFF